MDYVVVGSLAFIFFLLFDLNSIYKIHSLFNVLFIVGLLFLVSATIGIVMKSEVSFALSVTTRWGFIVMAATSLMFLIYALFFALPLTKTYVSVAEKYEVVDSGIYGICRHPSAISFILFYVFIWLASGKNLVLLAGLIWSFLNILYVYVQDVWIFPKSINGYNNYKERVPFFPNLRVMFDFLKR